MNEDKAVAVPWNSYYGLSVALGHCDYMADKPLPESKGLEVKEVNKWAGKDVP